MPLPAPTQILETPGQYISWRPGQREAVEWLVKHFTEFNVAILNQPVGAGKSVAYIVLALLLGVRTIVLTSTKALQDQIIGDFKSLDLRDIRGQQNYKCSLTAREVKYLAPWANQDENSAYLVGVDEALCQDPDFQCPLKDEGCDYFDGVRAAEQAMVVVTNYSCWMAMQRSRVNIGSFGLMVCDEAHDIESQVGGWVSVEMSLEELRAEGLGKSLEGVKSWGVEEWKSWAGLTALSLRVRKQQSRLSRGVGPAAFGTSWKKVSERLLRSIDTLGGLSGRWVLEWVEEGKVKFDPVELKDYSRSMVFGSTPKLVLTSATVSLKTLEQNGLSVHAAGGGVYESKSIFPVEQRPFIYVPSMNLNWRTEQNQEKVRAWVARMDQVIGSRLEMNRRGIIHTISFKRRRAIMQYSRYRKEFNAPESRDVARAMEEFKQGAGAPVIIGPSFGTGYNFPGDTARWQVICKVPIPDSRSVVNKARNALDSERPWAQAMTELGQIYGRIVRGEEDWGETFILDGNILWVKRKYGKFAPGYLWEAFQIRQAIPKPMPEPVWR